MMKELIQKYQGLKKLCESNVKMAKYKHTKEVLEEMASIYEDFISDLTSLQSKGKTKEVIWTDADIEEAFWYGQQKSNGKPAYNVLTWFPYFKKGKIDAQNEADNQSPQP